MNVFNNREIATVIWVVVFFVIVLFNAGIRESLLRLARMFLNIKILFSTFLMAIYTTGIVFLLHKIHCWDFGLLKDTIIWFCLSGIVIFFDSVTSENKKGLFGKILKDSVKVIILLEFLVNTVTFSLIGEVVFLPIMTGIVVVATCVETDVEYLSVAKLMNGLLGIIGVVLLFYVIKNVVSDYKDLASFGTLRSFLLTPLLTIMFLPFVYIFALYANYEMLYIQLTIGPEKSVKLKIYAMINIVRYCRFSLEKTQRVLNMGVYNLMQISSNDDVKEMLRVYRGNVSKETEANPLDDFDTDDIVDFDDDWGSYTGTDYEQELRDELREHFRKLYGQLKSFKNTDDFMFYGFGTGGPYNKWLKEVEKMRDKYPGRLQIQENMIFGDLIVLGLKYVSSKGSDPDMSRNLSQRIEKVIQKNS